MNNEIKSGIVFFSFATAIFMTILGIIALVDCLDTHNKNEYLEMRIKEQSMLIEYLKKENK
jgi:hypothetical protein